MRRQARLERMRKAVSRGAAKDGAAKHGDDDDVVEEEAAPRKRTPRRDSAHAGRGQHAGEQRRRERAP